MRPFDFAANRRAGIDRKISLSRQAGILPAFLLCRLKACRPGQAGKPGFQSIKGELTSTHANRLTQFELVRVIK